MWICYHVQKDVFQSKNWNIMHVYNCDFEPCGDFALIVRSWTWKVLLREFNQLTDIIWVTHTSVVNWIFRSIYVTVSLNVHVGNIWKASFPEYIPRCMLFCVASFEDLVLSSDLFVMQKNPFFGLVFGFYFLSCKPKKFNVSSWCLTKWCNMSKDLFMSKDLIMRHSISRECV